MSVFRAYFDPGPEFQGRTTDFLGRSKLGIESRMGILKPVLCKQISMYPFCRTLSVLALMFGFFLSSLSSQPLEEIARLTESLDLPLSDQQRVDTLLEIAFLYISFDPEKMETYAEKAHQMAQQTGYKEGEGLALRTLGIASSVRGRYQAALPYYEGAVQVFKKEKDAFNLGTAYGNLAIGLQQLNRYSEALAVFEKIFVLADSLGDDQTKMRSLNNLGLLYADIGEYPKALDNFQQTLDYKASQGDSAGMSTTLVNIGYVHEKQGDWELAQSYYEQSLQISQKVGDKVMESDAHHNIGLMLDQQQKYDNAKHHFEQAVQILEQLNNENGKSETLLAMAEMLRKQGEIKEAKQKLLIAMKVPEFLEVPEFLAEAKVIEGRLEQNLQQYSQAIKYFQAAHQAASKAGLQEYERLSLSGLAESFSAIGQYDSAHFYLNEYVALQDSLFNEDRSQQIAFMETRFDTRQKEATIDLLKENERLKTSQLKSSRNALIITGIALILLGGLALLLFRSNRIRKATNTALSQANEQKELLLHEIHHRVKNNLQTISSLLRLQAKYIEDPTAIDAINEGRNRVKSMALIHQKLYQGDQLNLIDMIKYIEDLTKNLRHAYRDRMDNVKIHTHISDISLDVDTAIPLGLILNELIINAMKYAFPNDRSGQIRIDMDVVAPNDLVVTVSDDGVGMQDVPDIESSQSFGMKLIHTMAKNLNGHLQIDHKKGTKFVLAIPTFDVRGRYNVIP